jgi:predicted TIM-barrel fold metal-dependent hydrolase
MSTQSVGRIFTVVMLLALSSASGQTAEPPLDGADGRPLALENFRPQPMLRVPEHPRARAVHPVVDVHVHPTVRLHEQPEALDQFVRLMDDQNIAVCISLDGGLGDRLREHSAYLWTKYRDRFVIFATMDWRGAGKADDPSTWDCHRPEFARRIATQLAEAKAAGASGLKFFKEFGLTLKNPDGSRVRIDDPRWDPIWQACGELGLPVLIHAADPVAFFEPIDAKNERWEELSRHPDWSFYGPQFPSHEEVLAELLRVVERHPKTTFIAAHMANSAEDLQRLAGWLDAHPNLNVDLAARIAELGRQPVTARKFLLKYADRVLFGSDGPRDPERMRLHWRFLETEDEYFPYAENAFPPQGFWRIYGLNLPDDVLRKVYHENAVRLIPGVRERLNATGRTPSPSE